MENTDSQPPCRVALFVRSMLEAGRCGRGSSWGAVHLRLHDGLAGSSSANFASRLRCSPSQPRARARDHFDGHGVPSRRRRSRNQQRKRSRVLLARQWQAPPLVRAQSDAGLDVSASHPRKLREPPRAGDGCKRLRVPAARGAGAARSSSKGVHGGDGCELSVWHAPVCAGRRAAGWQASNTRAAAPPSLPILTAG